MEDNTIVLLDAREDDEGISAEPYTEVLKIARQKCPLTHRLMRLKDFMDFSKDSVAKARCSAWEVFDASAPTPPLTPCPFPLPILVDTYLTGWTIETDGTYTTLVVEGDQTIKRVIIPPMGKIYEINELGLPIRTGGRKTRPSEAFAHTWWAFASDQIRNSSGEAKSNYKMALFGNEGFMGCFFELVKAYYSLDDIGGFYQVRAIPK